MPVQPQAARQGDRTHTAGLIEGVAVVVVPPTEHAHRRLTLGTAHQRLVTEDLAPSHVHDGLKGKAERKPQSLAATVAPRSQRFFLWKYGGHSWISGVWAMDP